MSVPSRVFLFRRNNGIYCIGYYDNGKKRWKSTGCRLKADWLKAVANLSTLFKKQPIRVTLSAFIQDFLLYAQATFSPSWVTIYRIALRHLQSMVGDCVLSTLCMRNIDDYKTKRLAEVCAVSVNHELQALRASMNVAVRWKHL